MSKITLHSDGACSGNPGKGAYAAILTTDGDKEKKFVKAFTLTTNNRMELLGIIEPLETIGKPSKIHIFSDSQYVVKAINEGWLNKWIEKEWKKSNNKPVLNIDLWERMRPLLLKHRLTFHWIRGHVGNLNNVRCDQRAVSACHGDNFSEDGGYKP